MKIFLIVLTVTIAITIINLFWQRYQLWRQDAKRPPEDVEWERQEVAKRIREMREEEKARKERYNHYHLP